MSIIWKPGDRAVFGWRPLSDLPPTAKWTERALSRVGSIGTVVGVPYEEKFGIMRVPFKCDNGDRFYPMVPSLFPIIEQPPRVQERERELVLK